MDCPQCGVADVIEIRHQLESDVELVFFSCHRCEEKWWDRDGKTVALREVLDLARRDRT